MVAASMGGLLHVTGDPAGPPTKVEGNWSGSDQGGRSWQPIGKGKNGAKIFVKCVLYYFRNKCVVFCV